MKSIRIYKDDIRVHILRSLFFTDTVVAGIGALFIALIDYVLFQYFFHSINWGYFLSTVIILEIFFVGLITQKVENQAIYKVIPRGIAFKAAKKELRQTELEPYFVDFSIQDNLIVRKNSIIGIFEVEPFDIALLNEEDREHFFVKLRQSIHVLTSQVQFLVRKEKIIEKDLTKHIFSLYDSSDKSREPLITQYIKDLKSLVEDGNFLTTRHYAVFSVPAKTTNAGSKISAIRKLHDLRIRFAAALSACRISVKQLGSDELVEFARQTLR